MSGLKHALAQLRGNLEIAVFPPKDHGTAVEMLKNYFLGALQHLWDEVVSVVAERLGLLDETLAKEEEEDMRDLLNDIARATRKSLEQHTKKYEEMWTKVISQLSRNDWNGFYAEQAKNHIRTNEQTVRLFFSLHHPT